MLILVLILFLLPITTIADKPVNAVKFVILDPNDSVVGAPITVTIEAQKSNNKVDTDYQNNVTLVTDGSATGAGLVDIVNGIGTIEINDNTAETVLLSLSDTESTGLDVSSTQEVDFVPDVDTTAPSAVNDLVLSDPTTSSITLSWTAPGDDENTGTAAVYDVRYSTSNINNKNKWNSAVQASDEPTPSVAGSSESMTVSGLSADTEYFFAIKTSDEVPNESEISNVPSLTTLAAPAPPGPSADLSITKSDSSDPITAGDILTYIITITNNGPDNAENVVVSDTLPLALTDPSIISSQGACAFFPCNIGTIANNNSVNITIASPTDSSIIGVITNIASISSNTDDPVVLNNVSTQETTILPPPEPEPEPEPEPIPSMGIPTTVIFSGKAFPNAKIFVVDKDVRFETMINQNTIADENGAFQVRFIKILMSQHSFGLMIKDKENRASQTKFFNINTLADDFVVKDILAPPTIEIPQRLVSRGQTIIIVGNGSPGNNIILEIDDAIKKQVDIEKDGSYKIKINTGILEFGAHIARAKQIDASQKRESDYSPFNTFEVSRLTLPKTDLSGDGVVNIQDWSMFLSFWISKNEDTRKEIDLNGDGKVNISDFSMFVRAIKK